GKLRGAGYVHAGNRADHAELQHGTDDRIVGIAGEGLRQGQRVGGATSVAAHPQQVHQLEPAADLEGGEVDHDVVAFRNALMIELSQRDRVDHQVAVIGNELERHRRIGRRSDRQLQEPRHAGVEDSEAVFPRQDFHERGVGQVDEGDVAQEAVCVEDVEEKLARGIEGCIGYDEVDVEIEVAPVQQAAAREPQIDSVGE